MQAVKNLLHSDKDKHATGNTLDETATSTGNTRTVAHGNHGLDSGVGSNTTSNSSGLGSNTTGYNSGATSTTTGSNVGNAGSLAAVGSGSTRAEETGTGRSVTGNTGDFANTHSIGHDHSLASKFDPNDANTTHDHKHLGHVTHRDVRHVEVEEVERQKEHDRHVHHVQHHVQPVIDKQVNPEHIHENIVPVTKISEKHASTEEDRGLLSNLTSKFSDNETHRQKERTVVDLGEKVHENVHHHVHHVTQPVVEQEVVDRHRIHTVIPTHHTSHEAPIIHKSSTHEPVTMDAFKSGGGKLGSNVAIDQAGLLNDGTCERTVDGEGESLAQKLNLKAGTTAGEHATSTHI